MLLDTQTVQCPYCGESIELLIDSSVAEQEYYEDCSVCCRPICVQQQLNSETGISYVNVKRDDE